MRGKQEKLEWDDVLIIAEHFGTSFRACYYRIFSLYPYLVSNRLPKAAGKQGYKPAKRREQLEMNDVDLLSGLFDAWHDMNFSLSTEAVQLIFKSNYIYNDSRLEGVETEYEAVAEIVADLLNNTQKSGYCNEKYESYCHVAGHATMYDYIFSQYGRDKGFSLYDTLTLNKILFSCFPYPDFGGSFRQDNKLVMGAKFETVDYHDIMSEMVKLAGICADLEANAESMRHSDVIKTIVRIHHRLTVIHPFGDGNGRTSRGFVNELQMRYHMVPVYVKVEEKAKYLDALMIADLNGDFSKLYEFFMRAMIRSYAELLQNQELK